MVNLYLPLRVRATDSTKPHGKPLATMASSSSKRSVIFGIPLSDFNGMRSPFLAEERMGRLVRQLATH